MEAVNQLLREAGVLGRIVNDFDPELQLDIIYGDIRISPGNTVLAAELQHRPDRFQYLHDPALPEILETFEDPIFITVVSLNHISSLFFQIFLLVYLGN